MDRQGLVELARCLKDTMNSDSWLDFANAYVALGVYLSVKVYCHRSRVSTNSRQMNKLFQTC